MLTAKIVRAVDDKVLAGTEIKAGQSSQEATISAARAAAVSGGSAT
jgi:hypothetical protein